MSFSASFPGCYHCFVIAVIHVRNASWQSYPLVDAQQPVLCLVVFLGLLVLVVQVRVDALGIIIIGGWAVQLRRVC